VGVFLIHCFVLFGLGSEVPQAAGAYLGPPAAGWMLEIGTFFLRTETELVLKSCRVIPGRLVEAGFQFQFPEWADAAQNLVIRWCTTERPES
jgi:uncharacterized protein